MAVKYGKFEIPQQISVDEETLSQTFGRFIAEPFEKGFGHTVGNSLRRMMLSSLEAPAIVAVRIEGISHEYMAIEGIVEDMTNIILNLKGALIRKLPMDDSPISREDRIVTSMLEISQEDLDKNQGQCHIKLGDIFTDGNYEVVNPLLHLFTVSQPMRRQIDLRVMIGRGYVPSDRLDFHGKTSDEILIDAAFSPVRLVNYTVENTRVGQDTDFDRLLLEILTDGRVTPAEALAFAAQIAVKHMSVFTQINPHMLLFDEGLSSDDADQDAIMAKLALRIDEIELSVRSTNCLSGANIDTIAELVSIPERRMLEFRNFGKKSLNEIKAKLTEMGLHLGMDLSKYGITADNVKEKVAQYHKEVKDKSEVLKVSEE